MSRHTLLCALAASSLLASCDVLGTKQARCDLRPNRDQCTDIRDFPGPSLVVFENLCGSLNQSAGGASYAEGEVCDLTGALGGCQSTSVDGTDQTNWYFPGARYPSSAEAMAECDSGQTWVTP